MDTESLARASYMAGQTLVYALLMLIAVFVVRKLISNHYKKKQVQREASVQKERRPAENLEIQAPVLEDAHRENRVPSEHLEIQELPADDGPRE